jgi:hypothetical protein
MIRMPEISRFYGIVVRMFSEPGVPHHAPHFHAYYQEAQAVYSLDAIECLEGSLPRAQARLVEAWAELHRDELKRDWELLEAGSPPVPVQPLR